MSDRELLIFLHKRLTNLYGEHHLADYMHRLRAIINAQQNGVRQPDTHKSITTLEEETHAN